MTRWVTAVALVVAASAFAWADGQKDELTPDERKELEAKAAVLVQEGDDLYRAGKLSEATPRIEKALELWRKLYPPDKYPDGHLDLATTLNSLGLVLKLQGRPAAA